MSCGRGSLADLFLGLLRRVSSLRKLARACDLTVLLRCLFADLAGSFQCSAVGLLGTAGQSDSGHPASAAVASQPSCPAAPAAQRSSGLARALQAGLPPCTTWTLQSRGGRVTSTQVAHQFVVVVVAAT